MQPRQIIDQGMARVVLLQNEERPRFINKATGKVFILVRDDRNYNDKLYLAPLGMMTSMFSLKEDQLNEEYKPYTPVHERLSDLTGPTPSEPPKKRGRPKGVKDSKPRVVKKGT